MLIPSDSVQKGLYMRHQKNHEYTFCEVINIISASLLLPISFFYVYLFIFLSIRGYRSSSRIISLSPPLQTSSQICLPQILRLYRHTNSWIRGYVSRDETPTGILCQTCAGISTTLLRKNHAYLAKSMALKVLVSNPCFCSIFEAALIMDSFVWWEFRKNSNVVSTAYCITVTCDEWNQNYLNYKYKKLL